MQDPKQYRLGISIAIKLWMNAVEGGITITALTERVRRVMDKQE
jgi:hypothetical protein